MLLWANEDIANLKDPTVVRSSVGFYTNNRSMFQMYAAFGK
jgi:hypothetical protein